MISSHELFAYYSIQKKFNLETSKSKGMSLSIDQVDTSMLFTILGFILTFLSLMYLAYQIRSSTLIKRNEYVENLSNTTNDDPRITSFLQMIEYDQKWYGNDFHGSSLELKVDATLNRFNFICYLEETRVLRYREMRFFDYQIRMILKNGEMIVYLIDILCWTSSLEDISDNIDATAEERLHNIIDLHPYSFLFKKAIKLRYICEYDLYDVLSIKVEE